MTDPLYSPEPGAAAAARTGAFLRTCLTIDPSACVAPTAGVLGHATLGPDSGAWPTAVRRGDDAPPEVGRGTNLHGSLG